MEDKINSKYGNYARKISSCRSCGSEELRDILSLGDLYVTNFVDSEEDQGPKIPLNLVLCNPEKGCGLLQLEHTTRSDLMWGDQYWYKSGINSMIRADLKDIVEKSKAIFPLKSEDIVIDIGCNDGTMLGYYNVPGLKLVGFEPSGNVAIESSAKGIEVINDFFGAAPYISKFGDKKAKIITAISMFYDLDDPNNFLEDIAKCLDKDGLFVIQQNYLATMLQNNAIDNICHEHLEYYSYDALEHLLNRHGFETFDVELNEINGGSIRNYIRFKGSKIHQSDEAKKRLREILKFEGENKLKEIETYNNFARRMDSLKKELVNFLMEKKREGKTICALGASTRGNTALQYFGLTHSLIDCIFDKNPDKEGKKAVGSLIPITSPDNIDKYDPDYQLVLIWHIFKGIGDDEKKFTEKGGKFILPLPEMKIKGKAIRKALITGITGQDGGYLAEFLLEKGYEVYGMHRRSSTDGHHERLEHLKGKIKLVCADLLDAASLDKIMRKIKPDEIYNLAAQSQVRISFDQKFLTKEINLFGVERLLDSMEEHVPNARFYQASTSEMFGNAEDSPQNENTPFRPVSPYGVAKLKAHEAIRRARERGLFACGGILFNHESPRRGLDFVTRKFTHGIARTKLGLPQRKTGKYFLELGNLDARRDWGYAKDYVEAMWLMLQQDKPEDFIIATGKTHSIRDFIEAATDAIGIKITWKGEGINEEGFDQNGRKIIGINEELFRPAELHELKGDSLKAKEILGWEPRVKFEELVKMMVESDLKKAESREKLIF